jgi:hypothetical protein
MPFFTLLGWWSRNKQKGKQKREERTVDKRYTSL